MIDDVKISEELTENFYSEFLKSENRLNVGFSVSVLRTENWPLGLSSVSSFRIPKQLTPCIQYVSISIISISIFHKLQLFIILFIYTSLKSSTKQNFVEES